VHGVDDLAIALPAGKRSIAEPSVTVNREPGPGEGDTRGLLGTVQVGGEHGCEPVATAPRAEFDGLPAAAVSVHIGQRCPPCRDLAPP
jgi:hypothetical protein